MSKKMESILKLLGEYDRFCNETPEISVTKPDLFDELNENELDLVAAAVQTPVMPELKEKK